MYLILFKNMSPPCEPFMHPLTEPKLGYKSQINKRLAGIWLPRTPSSFPYPAYDFGTTHGRVCIHQHFSSHQT